MIERALDWDMAATTSDDDRKLALEVEALRHRGADHLAVVAGQRVGEADEHARLFRQLAPSLGGMGAVINASAENFFRVWDHRQPFDVGPLVVGFGRVCGLPYFSKPAGRERVTQARVTETLVQGDDAIVGHYTEARLSIGHIACKLHLQRHVARARWPAESRCTLTSARRYCP